MRWYGEACGPLQWKPRSSTFEGDCAERKGQKRVGSDLAGPAGQRNLPLSPQSRAALTAPGLLIRRAGLSRPYVFLSLLLYFSRPLLALFCKLQHASVARRSMIQAESLRHRSAVPSNLSAGLAQPVSGWRWRVRHLASLRSVKSGRSYRGYRAPKTLEWVGYEEP